MGLAGDFPLGWFPAHPGTFKNQRFPTGKFLLHGLREGNQDEVPHLCSAAAAAGAGQRRSPPEPLPVPGGAGRSWQGWAERLSPHQTLAGAASCKDSEQRGSILSLLSPRDGGGHTVSPQPGWQDGRSGCQAAAPALFLCRSLGRHPPRPTGRRGSEMPHSEWQHRGGALGAGRDGQGDPRCLPSEAQTLGTSLHRPAWEDMCPERGTRSWGKPTAAAAPAELSERRAAPIPRACRRESGGGRGAAGGQGEDPAHGPPE